MTSEKLRTVMIAAIDRSLAAEQVIHTAIAMARVIPGAELHLVHVVEAGPQGTVLGATEIDDIRDGRNYLEQIVARIAKTLPRSVSGHLTVGAPAARIVQLASDLNADLLIVGMQQKNALERMVLGSVSRAVAAKAHCAVLVARGKDHPAVPEIEPPCPQCTEVQRATAGTQLWCQRHSMRHAHGRLHYQVPAAFGTGAMFFRAET
ncbi:MAG TPA: universal stress protein [Labilithrix sp.]|jgi:nucleotide-binding universal stress UspA family protein|nr:universal stress protein [Labilithrix sp.]